VDLAVQAVRLCPARLADPLVPLVLVGLADHLDPVVQVVLVGRRVQHLPVVLHLRVPKACLAPAVRALLVDRRVLVVLVDPVDPSVLALQLEHQHPVLLAFQVVPHHQHLREVLPVRVDPLDMACTVVEMAHHMAALEAFLGCQAHQGYLVFRAFQAYQRDPMVLVDQEGSIRRIARLSSQ